MLWVCYTHSVMTKNLLRFGFENAKLKGIWHFSLPSGYTCPGAGGCLTYAIKETGKIKDGPNQNYRCYAAMDEARYPSVRRQRWHNFDLLNATKTVTRMVNLICKSLPEAIKTVGGIMRVHIGGDFKTLNYMKAWLLVARKYPRSQFYAYTKSLKWLKVCQDNNLIPDNFSFTQSWDGKYDDMIDGIGEKSARVFVDPDELKASGLEHDHDDSHAIHNKRGQDFALHIHGSQPKGSKASAGLKKFDKAGVKGYTNKSKCT
jgi:hypothetical protein